MTSSAAIVSPIVVRMAASRHSLVIWKPTQGRNRWTNAAAAILRAAQNNADAAKSQPEPPVGSHDDNHAGAACPQQTSSSQRPSKNTSAFMNSSPNESGM